MILHWTGLARALRWEEEGTAPSLEGWLLSADGGLRSWDALVSSARLPSPVEHLNDDRLRTKGVQVWLKRDDLIHPDVPGNKWRKLKYNLHEMITQNHRVLLTFGGAYSNHLRATAAAGRACGISTIGIVRGEEHLPLNPSLAYAVSHGMRLGYLDRATYRKKNDRNVIASLQRKYGSFYLLPEGGTNELAVLGCSEILAELEPGFDVICCPCGTGGTLAGIVGTLSADQYAIGFSALKGATFLESDIAALQRRTFGVRTRNWRIEYGYHFGGFAKKNADLEFFIAEFKRLHGLDLEWVYVAKMMYGLYAVIDRGDIARGSKVMAIITGPPGPE